MKFIAILLCLFVAACGTRTATITAEDNPPLEKGELVRATTAVAGEGIAGVETTFRIIRYRDPVTGEEAPMLIDVFETPNTGGEIVKAVAPVAVGTLINGGFGLAISKQSACKGGNCGTSISVTGGTGVATSGSTSDAGAAVEVTQDTQSTCVTCSAFKP